MNLSEAEFKRAFFYECSNFGFTPAESAGLYKSAEVYIFPELEKQAFDMPDFGEIFKNPLMMMLLMGGLGGIGGSAGGMGPLGTILMMMMMGAGGYFGGKALGGGKKKETPPGDAKPQVDPKSSVAGTAASTYPQSMAPNRQEISEGFPASTFAAQQTGQQAAAKQTGQQAAAQQTGQQAAAGQAAAAQVASQAAPQAASSRTRPFNRAGGQYDPAVQMGDVFANTNQYIPLTSEEEEHRQAVRHRIASQNPVERVLLSSIFNPLSPGKWSW